MYLVSSYCNVDLNCSALINYTEDTEEPSRYGYMYALAIFFASLIQSMIFNQYMYTSMMVGLRLRSTLCAAVYSKVSVM